MAKIPLILRLKKERHRKIAQAQDLIVGALFKIFNNAIIHGGTAIWRCYNGNRFSEDVDAYIQKDNRVENLFSEFKKLGFAIEKKKISENSIYSNLNFEGTEVRFEAIFKKEKSVLKDYETAEGNFWAVYSLSAENFVKEKIETYLKRKKIRDLYDIFFMLKFNDKNLVKNELKKFVGGYSPPLDEGDLKAVIIEGISPDSEKMLEYIKSFI